MSLPDPFSLCVALLPLIVYLLVFGGFRILGRPLVMTGSREIAALGGAIAGFMAVGPAQLFFPAAAGALFGWKVWLMLAAFYVLCVALIALTTRARICVYGMMADEVFPHVTNALRVLDDDVEVDRVKQQFFFPKHGLRLRLESHAGIDHVALVAFEPNVSAAFWLRLRAALRQELRPVRTAVGTRGIGMIVTVILLSGFLLSQAVPNQPLLVEGFRQWLYRE